MKKHSEFDYSPELRTFAQQMVDHPHFPTLLATVKGNALAELMGTRPDEADRRELLYKQIKAYDDLEANMRAIAASHKFGG